MGLFGKSFEEEVNEALEKVRGKFPHASVSATVDGKVVTLRGEAPDMDTKTRIMTEFNDLVKTENTMNQINIPKPAAQPAAAGAPGPVMAPTAAAAKAGGGVAVAARTYVVKQGDTLSAIAKQHYGDANKYMKIFEANRNILDNPDKIKPGQELVIPE